MAGMMFIVTIPTEKEEHGQNETSGHLLFERLTENQSDENVKFSGESIMSHDLLGENTVAINISGPSIPLSHQMLANDEVETLAHKESVESDVKSKSTVSFILRFSCNLIALCCVRDNFLFKIDYYLRTKIRHSDYILSAHLRFSQLRLGRNRTSLNLNIPISERFPTDTN